MKNDIKKNYLYNVAYSILNMLLPLVTAPYLSRVLGVSGIGEFSYCYAIAQYFVLIAKLGLTNFGTREISKSQAKSKSLLFSNLFYMQIISTVFVSIIYFIYVLLFSGSHKVVSLVLFFWILFSFLDIDWFWFGEEEFKRVSIRNISIKLLSVIFIFIFVKESTDLIKYTIIMTFSFILGYLSIWIGVKKRIHLEKLDWKLIKKYFFPCLVMLIPVLALNIYRSMDKVMLGIISGIDETGIYENGEKLVYCMSALISSLGTVMMPKISSLVETNDKNQVYNYINKSLKLMTLMTSIMAFGLMVISDNITVLLFGENFKESSSVLFLCAPTLIFMGWSSVIRTQYIIPMKKDNIYIKSITFGCIINLVLNIILIPKYSIQGAVIGTICAELFVPIYQYFNLKKELNYKKYLKNSIFFVIIGLIMLLLLQSIHEFFDISIFSLFMQIFIGGIIYIALLFMYVKFFDKELKEEILSLIKKKR